MLIYNSLFDSRLRYGILGWGTASEKHLSKLRVLQNRAVRLITFSSFRSSMAPLYASLKILPLNEQLFLQRTIFMHGLHHKSLPFALSAYCTQPNHGYSTRYKTAGNYVLPYAGTNRTQSSIKYAGPKAWGDVPKHLKEIAFRKPFSKKFKEHILQRIYVEMPPKSMHTSENYENDCYEELMMLFETDNEEDDFLGFDTSKHIDLASIFLEKSITEDFLGF